MNILRTAAAMAAVAAATACSNIADDERLIYVKPAEVGRTVLIEDFTGQRCIYCPRGTETIDAIADTYGSDNVVAVAIHSGPLGFTGNSRYPLGLVTDAGSEYYRHWDGDNKMSQPWVLFNRSTSPNGEYNTWANYVKDIISQKARLSIGISNAYDSASRTVSIGIDAMGTDGSTTGKLQVWLVEDGIVAMQMMPDGTVNAQYTHNHVFRAAVNGTWGDDITVKEGEHTARQYTYTLPEEWNADNVSVVAFVYNDGGVEQTAKRPVVAAEP